LGSVIGQDDRRDIAGDLEERSVAGTPHIDSDRREPLTEVRATHGVARALAWEEPLMWIRQVGR
jgi:hypothetical protein